MHKSITLAGSKAVCMIVIISTIVEKVKSEVSEEPCNCTNKGMKVQLKSMYLQV